MSPRVCIKRKQRIKYNIEQGISNVEVGKNLIIRNSLFDIQYSVAHVSVKTHTLRLYKNINNGKIAAKGSLFKVSYLRTGF